MKKTYLIIISLIILVGCTLGNIPTSRVEEYLTNYQMLNNNISTSYTNLTNDTNLSQDIKNRYEKAIKKQYRNLSYEVKEEIIDGDEATVTIQLKVMNYRDAFDKYNQNEYEKNEYHTLILDTLENTKEMVSYTLDITLTKDDNDNWVIDNLNQENKDKLLGIY